MYQGWVKNLTVWQVTPKLTQRLWVMVGRIPEAQHRREDAVFQDDFVSRMRHALSVSCAHDRCDAKIGRRLQDDFVAVTVAEPWPWPSRGGCGATSA